MSFIALATLKPQAGLVAPQAVPASQPAAAVSDLFLICLFNLIIQTNSYTKCVWKYICQLNKPAIFHLSVRVMVLCQWRLVNKLE